MNLFYNIILNTYSMIILVIILFQLSKQAEKDSTQFKIYKFMIHLTKILLFIDIFSRFDGNKDTIFPVINHVSNFLIFLLCPLLPSLWLFYVYNHVCNNQAKIKRLIIALAVINLFYIILLVFSLHYGWYYQITSDNIYKRGPLFIIPAILVVGFLVVAFFKIFFNHKDIDKNHYYSLLLFGVPPLIGAILQIAFYGISIVLNSIVVSLLLVFLNIQNHNIHTDYLTRIYNRKKLVSYLNRKLTAVTKNKTFAGVLIDLDNFKYINDNYGHDIGDEALQVSARLIKNCIRSKDFLARFGGDEFYLVLDTSDISEVEKTIGDINNAVDNFNATSERPYKISFSMGYAVYDYNSKMTIEDFNIHIDKLMYENKRNSKRDLNNK